MWADKIVESYKKYGNSKTEYDVSGYAITNVISTYKELYEGR